jgi:hypothetical protein
VTPSASASPSTSTRSFQAALLLLWAAGLGAIAYFAFVGADYYATPVGLRARHPGYWTLKPGGSWGLRFGVAGLLLMTVMHAYSIRKRLSPLRRLGRLRAWLDLHILCGVIGPLFIVLHSSLKIGGLIAISFWSMVAVAVSGIFGRYLYLQIPRTRAGEEITLADAQRRLGELHQRLRQEGGADDAFLARLEAAAAPPASAGLFAVLASVLAWDLDPRRRARVRALARSLPDVPAHLVRDVEEAVTEAALLRRRVQLWDALHRLFHHWHVVHKPFAIVMYLFALVHVAVATFTGYGLRW